MAPNLSTVRRGPVPATAFCPACYRNLADCQCSCEATPVCGSCSTAAGQHHHGCFRCPPVAAAITAHLAEDNRTRFNASLRDQIQHIGCAL